MKKGREEILIIATGGTIEAPRYPNGYDRDPAFNTTSVIPALFEKYKYNYPYAFAIPFMKDSRHITDADREKISEVIASHPHTKILISHGTMTLSDTHAFLQSRKEKFPGKTIVLFGANMPSNVFNSDAGINLGFALGSCLYAPPNVYLAMNGILLKSLSCKVDGIWKEKE